MNKEKSYSWYECCHKMRSAAKDALDHKRDGQMELASLAVAAVREWANRADWAMAHDGECVLEDYNYRDSVKPTMTVSASVANPETIKAFAGLANHLTKRELSKEDQLRVTLEVLISHILTILDSVDYTTGACQCTEMVGAVLDKQIISNARKAVDKARGIK